MLNQIETQEDYANESIIVGIDNLRTKIAMNGDIFIPTITIKISTMKKRGAHMSRLIESASESINTVSSKSFSKSLEEYCYSVYKDLKTRHPFDYFEIFLRTELAVSTTTPFTKLKTIEVHDVGLKLIVEADNMKKHMFVTVIGGSACPHAAINNSKGRTHLQRSKIDMEYETTDLSRSVEFETLIDICNNSFSSQVYTLLKTEDEQHVVNAMFEKPCFVEDELRNIMQLSNNLLPEGTVRATVTNYESIHRHNAVAFKQFKIPSTKKE